ncbi:MAG: O-antigen ligase family protein [Methylobacter sp.]
MDKALGKIHGMADKAGGIFTALFMASIYFSTSLSTIFSVILGLLWLFSGQLASLLKLLKSHPVALSSLLLYGHFMLGLSYGDAAGSEAIAMMSKYRELFFIPILILCLRLEQYRNWTRYAFIAASVTTLLISYLMDFGLLHLNVQGDPCVKSRITHGIFIAFFAFFCMHKLYDNDRFSKLYLVALLLSLYNLFFVVEGRTGQLIIVALILLFVMQRLTFKYCLLTLLAVILLLTLFIDFSSKASRIIEGFDNTQAYLQPVPEQTESSMGLRYTFWKYSLKLMAEKPLLGQGTGGFDKAYQGIVRGDQFITKNPHNEFFMVGVQLGLLGVLTYLGFLGSQLYSARLLSANEKWLAQGLLMSLVITSLFNAPFFDHTEGHWFACMIALCFSSISSANKPCSV